MNTLSKKIAAAGLMASTAFTAVAGEAEAASKKPVPQQSYLNKCTEIAKTSGIEHLGNKGFVVSPDQTIGCIFNYMGGRDIFSKGYNMNNDADNRQYAAAYNQAAAQDGRAAQQAARAQERQERQDNSLTDSITRQATGQATSAVRSAVSRALSNVLKMF